MWYKISNITWVQRGQIEGKPEQQQLPHMSKQSQYLVTALLTGFVVV